MSSYAGLDEQGLRKLLDTSSDINERRKIRAALRELRTTNNNNIAHPHIRSSAISPSKLSHHQSFRTERRRRPENDDAEAAKKRSQDDDVLYRSRRKREMEGRGVGGGEEGDDENEENDVDDDVEAKIKEIGSNEEKLSLLLSETRDFNDRRKVRSAIREVKRSKNRQDDSDSSSARSQPSSFRDDRPTPSVNIQKENKTNLALSGSSRGQGSNAEKSKVTENGQSDVEKQIDALQKQHDNAKTYEERRKLRTEIRELRQNKTGKTQDRCED